MKDMAILKAALKERGITSAEDFRKRFGAPLAAFTVADALAIVHLPAWVTDVWLPHAGSTHVVAVPQAVRRYGELLGLKQRDDDDHDYAARLQAAFKEGVQP